LCNTETCRQQFAAQYGNEDRISGLTTWASRFPLAVEEHSTSRGEASSHFAQETSCNARPSCRVSARYRHKYVSHHHHGLRICKPCTPRSREKPNTTAAGAVFHILAAAHVDYLIWAVSREHLPGAFTGWRRHKRCAGDQCSRKQKWKAIHLR
jgi:hypothetical protein